MGTGMVLELLHIFFIFCSWKFPNCSGERLHRFSHTSPLKGLATIQVVPADPKELPAQDAEKKSENHEELWAIQVC